jgi:diaminohydroxyphosphoribosylaminopyrimidine deaminase/5-amino-6-(5-phosphoribosylamino)uracil reductase
MYRALQLARLGQESCSPNPMVGCVIVHENKIIGEGWHRKAGEPHAEVMAIRSVKNQSLLSKSSLYVTLEPCSHFGRTPPCSHLIIDKKIPRVYIANLDPNPVVAGAGIQLLKENGILVKTGILADQGEHLNRRFFLYHREKRPYIILKWAESADGFMDVKRSSEQKGSIAISGHQTRFYSHKWRSEEDAILVGRNTVEVDNPSLNTRFWSGKSPLRVILDPERKLDEQYKVFRADKNVVRFSVPSSSAYIESVKEIEIETFTIKSILDSLFKEQCLSILVEGGATSLRSFIDRGLWDEYRVFKSPNYLREGLKAPDLPCPPVSSFGIGNDQLLCAFNR